MANIIEILFRAKDAQETASSAKQVADALRGLDAAGEQGAQGVDRLADSLEGVKQQSPQAASAVPSPQQPNPLPQINDAEARKIQRALDDIGRSADRTREQTGGMFSTISRGIDEIGRATGLGSGAARFVALGASAAAAGAAIGLAIREMRAGVQAAAEQETATKRLENALASVGQLSQQSLRALEEWADGIQRTTIFSDQLALSTAAVVAQIAQISGEKLQEVTEGVLDVAAALGKDAKSVAIQLAKGEVAELGIQIDATLPRAQRLDAALAQIQQKFGGSAAAEVDTYAGAVAQASNALAEMREEVGVRLLPVITQFAQGAKAAFEGLADLMERVRGTSRASLSELVAIFAQQATQLKSAVNPELERLNEGLRVLEERAIQQVRLDIQRGNIDDVLEQFGRIDDVVRNATGAGTREFEQFMDRLRSEANQAIEVRVQVSSQQAELAAAEAVRRIRGEEEIDVLLRGVPEFEAARRELDGLQTEAEKPATKQVSVEIVNLADLERQRQELGNKLDELFERKRRSPALVIETDATELQNQINDIESRITQARERIASGLQAGTVSVSLSAPSDQEVAATLADVDRKLQQASQFDVAIRLRLDEAESIDDVSAALRSIQDEVVKATAAARNEPLLRPVAQALLETADLARQLGSVKIRELVDRAAIDQLVDLNRQIREATAGTGADLRLVSDEDLRRATSLGSAVDLLIESLRDLDGVATPAQLVAFYNQLGEVIARNTENVRANKDELNRLAAELAERREVVLEPKIQLEQQRRQVEEFVQLIRQLQDVTGATTTARVIDTEQLVDFDSVAQGAENAARATEELVRVQEDLLQASPEALGRAYEQLDAALKRSASGQSNLTAEQVARVRELKAEVDRAVEALEPLERAQILSGQAKLDIETRQIDEAAIKLNRIKTIMESVPEEKRIQVIVELLEQDIEDARERGAEVGGALGEGLSEASQAALQAVGTGVGVVFQGMNDDAARTFANIENLGKAMVASLLSELAKLAALSIFKLLLASFSSGGVGLIPAITKFPKADAGGDLPPVEIPAPKVTVRVPEIPPIDLPGIVVEPGPVTVGDVPPVSLPAPQVTAADPEAISIPAPRITVGDAGSIDLPPPAIEMDDPEPVRIRPTVVAEDPDPVQVKPPFTVRGLDPVTLDPPALLLDQPDLSIGAIDPIRLDAPALQVGALGEISLPPPRLVLGDTEALQVQPRLEVGPITSPATAPLRDAVPPPAGSRMDDIIRASTVDLARSIETQAQQATFLRRLFADQPLQRTEDLAAVFTPTGTTSGKTVVIQEGAVKALDASDFGNYMTVGNGADALADAALEGA